MQVDGLRGEADERMQRLMLLDEVHNVMRLQQLRTIVCLRQ